MDHFSGGSLFLSGVIFFVGGPKFCVDYCTMSRISSGVILLNILKSMRSSRLCLRRKLSSSSRAITLRLISSSRFWLTWLLPSIRGCLFGFSGSRNKWFWLPSFGITKLFLFALLFLTWLTTCLFKFVPAPKPTRGKKAYKRKWSKLVYTTPPLRLLRYLIL